jgi:hypothetical protein
MDDIHHSKASLSPKFLDNVPCHEHFIAPFMLCQEIRSNKNRQQDGQRGHDL